MTLVTAHVGPLRRTDILIEDEALWVEQELVKGNARGGRIDKNTGSESAVGEWRNREGFLCKLLVCKRGGGV